MNILEINFRKITTFLICHNRKKNREKVRKATLTPTIRIRASTCIQLFADTKISTQESRFKSFRAAGDLWIAGFHPRSWRPYWCTLNKRILIISFVCGTNMAAIYLLSFVSLGIVWKPRILVDERSTSNRKAGYTKIFRYVWTWPNIQDNHYLWYTLWVTHSFNVAVHSIMFNNPLYNNPEAQNLLKICVYVGRSECSASRFLLTFQLHAVKIER